MELSKTNYNTVKSNLYKMAVLPWGATEPHNLHLPYSTDTILSLCVSLDASQKAYKKTGLQCMVLPPIGLGSQNPGQWDIPFCIHTRYETQKAILTDIVYSLSKQGLDKLVIVNGHGGNVFKNMVRDLIVDFPEFIIAVCDYFLLAPEKQKDIFEKEDNHAGEMETSLMLHYHPELVDMKVAGKGESKPFAIDSLNDKTAWIPRNWQKVSSDTGIGDPSAASAGKGKLFSNIVSDKLSELFIEISEGQIYI